jgi:4'-phosphopantetheinyl transferase EntD
VEWRDGAHVAVCPLDEGTTDAALSPRERELLRAASTEGRKREIRAGRLAAHAALRASGLSPPPEVLTADDLAPSLDPPSGCFLSLAHDGALAVAACARRTVGVDVVPLSRRPQIERVVRASLDSRGAPGLVDASFWPPELMLWTAWEALAKRTGEGVFGAMRHARLRAEADGPTATACLAESRLRWWGQAEHLFCLATERT